MSKKHLQAQLVAGGMVAVSAKVDNSVTEKVVARRYTGQALGKRVVVRLGAERLGPAEDLAMEFLGLQSGGESKPIAVQSRRALGFASWALVTHPENAKYALDLVKRIKAAARKAKSKPGHAWDQFTEMANELNRSVREFLPPFWEETARIYKDLGNTTYAGRSIGKALEAERVHALEVDPHRRRDAVLEFALSGCLSGKALTEYTKDLGRQFQPNEALETLRDLLVRRTLGGMPPMATSAKDLGRYTKAAGKDVDKEIESLLHAIIASPAMSRAPKQFWKSVSKQIGKLVATDDAFAVWLLVHTDPQPSYDGDSQVWDWIHLLDQWKVLPWLGKPAKELPADVEIPGGRAGWISRLIRMEPAPNNRVFELIELAADAIREENCAIQLGSGTYYGSVIDVDIVECCLDLGLEVSCMPQHSQLDFQGWLMKEVDHPRRNSQLKHLTEDDRFRSHVYEQIPALVSFAGSHRSGFGRSLPAMRSFDAAAVGHDAIHEVWWNFLDRKILKLEEGGLCDFEAAMEIVNKSVRKETCEQFPAVLQRLEKVDVPAALQRTLAAGVIDEYGWKDLDKADDQCRLPSSSRTRCGLVSMFPILTLLREGTVETVGPDGRRQRGEFELNKTTDLIIAIPVMKDVALVYRDRSIDYESRIRWLSEPEVAHQTEYYQVYQAETTPQIQWDDGVFYGTRILRSGDQVIPGMVHWLSDGERFWSLDDEDYSWNEFDHESSRVRSVGLKEIDPNTGKKIRESIPAWLEQSLPPGGEILWRLSQLLPAPAGMEISPLGIKDGLIGWRTLRRRDGRVEGRGIDGRQIVLDPGDAGFVALGMINQPESDSHWIALSTNELADEATGIRFADITKDRYAFGQPARLPLMFWHFYTVRCPASSKKLRSISHKEAKQLFDAAQLEHEALKRKEDPANPDPNRSAGFTAASKLFPSAPDRLVKGISRIARIAAVEHISLTKVIQRVINAEAKAKLTAQQDANAQAGEPNVPWEEIEAGLAELVYPLEGSGSGQSVGETIVNPQQIRDVVEFFKGGTIRSLAKGGDYYFSMIDDLPTAAWKTFWVHVHRDADRGVAVQERLKGPWLAALKFLADSDICTLPGSMAVYITAPLDGATEKKLKSQKRLPKHEKPIAFCEGKVRYVAYATPDYVNSRVAILAYVESGKLKPPKTFLIEDTIPLRKRWMKTSVKSFVNAVRQVKELPLVSEEQLQSAAKMLGMTPIQVALGWMGNFRTVRYGQEKLTKELRSHYGWKVNDIKTAIAALEADPPCLSVLSEGARLDAAGCIGKKVDRGFDRTINAWKESREETVPIPAEVVKKLQGLHSGYYGHTYLDMKWVNDLLVNPTTASAFQPCELAFELNKSNYSYQMIGEKFTPLRKSDESLVYLKMIRTAYLLNYELPAGDPVRRRLPEYLEAIRLYLDHESTTLPIGKHATHSGYDPNQVDRDATLDKFSGIVAPTKEAKSGLYEMDSGLIVAAIYPPSVSLRFRTSKLRTLHDWDKLVAAASITFDYESDGSTSLHFAQFVMNARDEATSALIETNRSDKIPPGSWEQDPRVSVPELVAEVIKKLKVSEEAATLYLQVLALHDPTNVRVKAWNDWSSKVLKTAVEELVSASHLVATKRSRAGRDHFLPGGWEPLKLPNLPMESWKLTMFGFKNTDALRGGSAEYIVCPRPVADQFQLTWQRVQRGDIPAYEEASVR